MILSLYAVMVRMDEAFGHHLVFLSVNYYYITIYIIVIVITVIKNMIVIVYVVIGIILAVPIFVTVVITTPLSLLEPSCCTLLSFFRPLPLSWLILAPLSAILAHLKPSWNNLGPS